MKTAQLRLAVLAAPIIMGMVGCAGGSHRFSASAERSEKELAPERLVAIARTFERQGRTDKAREIYSQIAAEQPAHAEAARRLQLIAARERQMQHRATAQGLMPAPSTLSHEQLLAAAELEIAKSSAAPATAPPPPDIFNVAAAKIPPATETPEADIDLADAQAADFELPVVMETTAPEVAELESPEPVVAEENPFLEPVIVTANSPATEADELESTEPALAEEDPFLEPVIVTASSPATEVVEADEFEPPLEINPRRRVDSVPAAPEFAESASVVIVATPPEPSVEGSKSHRVALAELATALSAPETPTGHIQQTSGEAFSGMTIRPAGANPPASAAVEPLDLELQVLISQLNDADVDVRRNAITQLAAMGKDAKAAIPALTMSLNDVSLFVQAHAARAIWEIDQRCDLCLPILADLLETNQPEVHEMAAYVLGSMGPGACRSLPGLHRLVNSGEGSARLHAAEAVLKINPEDRAAADVLVGMLSSEDADLRWLAAFALSAAGEEQSHRIVPHLTSALRDPDSRVKAVAALSLGSFGAAAKSAIEDLSALTENEIPELQEAAQIALACITEA